MYELSVITRKGIPQLVHICVDTQNVSGRLVPKPLAGFCPRLPPGFDTYERLLPRLHGPNETGHPAPALSPSVGCPRSETTSGVPSDNSAASTASTEVSILDFCLRRSFGKFKNLSDDSAASASSACFVISSKAHQKAEEHEQTRAASRAAIFSRTNFLGLCRQEAAPKNLQNRD